MREEGADAGVDLVIGKDAQAAVHIGIRGRSPLAEHLWRLGDEQQEMKKMNPQQP